MQDRENKQINDRVVLHSRDKEGALTRSLNKLNTDKRVPIDLQSGIHVNNATLSSQQDSRSEVQQTLKVSQLKPLILKKKQ